jgi:cell division septum initiation protein DivIVA
MTDTGMKGRVKGLLAGPVPGGEGPEQVDAPPNTSIAQRQALQVLTLAQRTAEEHVASAHHQADKICTDARGTAEQIVRDARAHADDLQRSADKVLSEARAKAAQMARDAQAHADNARRNADKLLAEARVRAEEIGKDAQANADELKHQAQQRYQDVVGSLAAKREGLQQQIEALEIFDRDYRSRLTAFMQAQLRALWVDEPQVNPEIEAPEDMPTTGTGVPAQKTHSHRS